VTALQLSAARWSVIEDFFEDLCLELNLPDWHGRNAAAFAETLLGRGEDHGLSYPLIIRLAETDDLAPPLRRQIASFIDDLEHHRLQHYPHRAVHILYQRTH
jgi:hypothetical protein